MWIHLSSWIPSDPVKARNMSVSQASWCHTMTPSDVLGPAERRGETSVLQMAQVCTGCRTSQGRGRGYVVTSVWFAWLPGDTGADSIVVFWCHSAKPSARTQVSETCLTFIDKKITGMRLLCELSLFCVQKKKCLICCSVWKSQV